MNKWKSNVLNTLFIYYLHWFCLATRVWQVTRLISARVMSPESGCYMQTNSIETAGPGSSGSGTRQWIRHLAVEAARPGSISGHGSCLDGILQARIGLQDFLRGGGGREDVHKHTHPLNIVRVTSSALQKIEKHPHSWTFTSTPPPGHCPYDVIQFRGGGGGGWSVPVTHAHFVV